MDTTPKTVTDTTIAVSEAVPPDTLINRTDTSAVLSPDTVTGTERIQDTVDEAEPEYGIKAKVEYKSTDSLRFNVEEKKVFIYGSAEIYYQEISLKSAYVDLDFQSKILNAKGLPDSTGRERGLPVFAESGQEFQSRTMKYNYETKKGLISDVVTEDGEGYVEGRTVKKMPDDEINIRRGSYTTCPPCENKDFEFRYFKSKVIPGKRIVTGPAYLVIEDVPTPLFIPFGIFPNRAGQRSGIVIPTWGESANRGFYFENGGYYWAINDYMDLRIVGDIYTRGSWALKPSFRYKKRYKFSGNFNLTYAVNILGEKGSPNYQKDRDYSIRWLHRQDPKARPNSTFSADVNIRSSKSNFYNPTSAQDYLSNTFQSSISYQTSFADKYFLTVNANHNQSTSDNIMNLTIPEINFTVSKFYPLRKKQRVGKLRWWENISIDYSLNAKNQVSVPDSLLFTPEVFDEMRNGLRHSLPITHSAKLFKYFTWSNRVSINDRMYFKAIEKSWVDSVFTAEDTIPAYEKIDTVSGFYNLVDYSFSSNISTRIYGLLQFGKKSPLNAIRHVITPSVAFSYNPSFRGSNWGYYDSYFNPVTGKEVEYSRFEGSLYGTPPKEKSGRINFSITNNLEIKVRSRKDTVTGTRKIALIDNFTISTSYDLAKDSLNWSKLSLSGRTRLFDGLDIRYSSTLDPYVLDSSGARNLDRSEWSVNRRLFRLDNTTWDFGLSYSFNANTFKKKGEKAGEQTEEIPEEEPRLGTAEEIDNIDRDIEDYIDWSIPWNLSLTYNLRISRDNDYVDNVKTTRENLVQTLGLRGDISITPKWKIGFITGWDFKANDLSYTSLNIYRDLHCFEMRLNWIPIGPRKSWNFALNIKSSLLQDMKLTKKKDFRDL